MPTREITIAARATAGILISFGLTLIVAGPSWFWWGVGAFYIGITAGLYLLYLSWAVLLSQGVRLLVYAVALALIVAFSVAFIFRAAPLEMTFFAPPHSEYPAGTKIGNITWQPDYVDLRLNFGNRTDYDFQKLDVVFKTNLTILAVSRR